MKIIILGAGQVGGTVAASLVTEANDITIVDSNPKQLKPLQERFDIRTIVGAASHPDVLIRAGIEDADLLIAVTSSDETNMVACQVAYTLFRTPTKIARVRASQYMLRKELFNNNALPIDVIISPEQLVTNYIHRLIKHPDALQVLNFADEKVQLVAVKAHQGGPLIGQELRNLKTHIPKVATRVVAIYRQDKSIDPSDDTIIEEGDEVFFIAAKKHIRTVIKEMRSLERSYKKIMIAGGGNIGLRLAEALESKYLVKIIERNSTRLQKLSLDLNHTIVLQGDAADRELLLDENIQDVDVFCAITNQDEANIMSAILAKRLGARKVLALVSRPAYIDVIEGGEIDIAVSPQQTTISSLLTYMRRGDVVKVHSLRRGAAEAIEAIAHGDKNSSQVIGKAIKDLKLPKGTTLAAIVRGNEVIITTDETVIESEDHAILFLTDKRHIHQVERLFQVGLSFF